MNKVRIILADDHEMMREGLQMLVNAQPDMEVVGVASNGRAAVTLAQKIQPDVVVMDISMPALNGLKATELLKRGCPPLKVVALTRHTTGGYLQALFRAGATGYVLKQSASGELVRAIRAVVLGHTYLDPAVACQVIINVSGSRGSRGAPAGQNLSPREEEVLRLTAWGYLSKEVAARLGISIKTAETHKAKGMAKLYMKGRVDIVRYALLQGWLQET